jgi:xylulose-5-phosphate/fructose-6-phosphate phosphoketolase
MMLVNWVSRFDVAKRALKGAAESNEKVKAKLDEMLKKIDDRVSEVKKFIQDESKGKFICHESDIFSTNMLLDPEDLYDMAKFE